LGTNLRPGTFEKTFEMAKIGMKVRISELRIKTGIDKNYLNQLLKSLIEKGLVYRVKRGEYTFTLPLFEKFLLRVE
jgi:predicted transcriptional regulator of viral defense system